MSTAQKPTRHRTLLLVTLLALVLGVLLAWAFFHPELKIDGTLVGPTVREQLSRTGFRATQAPLSVRFETVESQEGHRVTWVSRQTIAPMDALFTEKRSRRRTDALSQQTAGLYAGPIAVVRYARNWPPLVGDLLPYEFWESSRMAEFTIEEKSDFPDKVGGRMGASVTYENRSADGRIVKTEQRRLRCQITNRVDASSINASLSGPAVRIECKDSPATQSAGVTASDRSPTDDGEILYSHWYLLDSAWSISVEGEYPVRIGQLETMRRWSSKLMSVER